MLDEPVKNKNHVQGTGLQSNPSSLSSPRANLSHPTFSKHHAPHVKTNTKDVKDANQSSFIGLATIQDDAISIVSAGPTRSRQNHGSSLNPDTVPVKSSTPVSDSLEWTTTLANDEL